MIASKRIMRNEFRPQMENVWDYPRPPRVEPSKRRAKVELGGQTIADSDRALRVLETSHPPVIYIPAEDFADGSLSPSNAGRSFCEFKGFAEERNKGIDKATGDWILQLDADETVTDGLAKVAPSRWVRTR